jgi:hypothetical protein
VLPPGARLDDSAVYTVRDEHGLVSAAAIVRFTILVDPLIGSAGIEIIHFGLLNDTEPNDDLGSEDPRLQGTLAGELLTAAQFEIEFDLDASQGASGYAAHLAADVLFPLSVADGDFPDFQYDPSTVAPFSTDPGRKVIAYRARALDSNGELISRSFIDEQGIELLVPAQSAWQ